MDDQANSCKSSRRSWLRLGIELALVLAILGLLLLIWLPALVGPHPGLER